MYVIQLSSRMLVEELFRDYLGMDNTQKDTLIRLIDRMKKMPYETFVAHVDAVMTPTQRETGVVENLMQLLKATKLEQLPAGFEEKPSVIRLKQLMTMLRDSRVTNVQFDITLMRGFDYYTDVVFEVVDTSPENNRSMFGGGRYDGLVGAFGVDPVPTVGFGMGDVTLQNFLETHDLLPKLHTETDAYVILIGENTYEKAQPVLTELRKMGLNIAVDSTSRKMDKQIKTAVKKGLHYAIFIGAAELDSGQYKLRNLVDGTEEAHSLQRIVSIAKDRRYAAEVPKDDDEDLDI
jgi:histidyl-tRNA synthetase